MSNNHHRTWQQHQVSKVLISIELDPVAGRLGLEHHRGLADLTRRLVTLFDSHRLPATWAVNDPAHSAATSLISRSVVDHELAILGDSNWLGATAGRTRFARELARRVSQARGVGIDVKTLIPRVASVKRDIDLVVKHQIAAVAGIEPPTHVAARWPVPKALHYGVWEIPVTDRLPRTSLWWFQGGRSVLRRIRRAARESATFHLAIDVASLGAAGPQAERSMVWLVRQVANLRDRGAIRIETLGQAAAQLADLPAVVPQRSILRCAA